MENYKSLSEYKIDELKILLGDHPEVNTKTKKDEIIKFILVKQANGEVIDLSLLEGSSSKSEDEDEEKKNEEVTPERVEDGIEGKTIYAYSWERTDLRTFRCRELKIVDGVVESFKLIAEDVQGIARNKMLKAQFQRVERY